jgi:hypothetical protein
MFGTRFLRSTLQLTAVLLAAFATTTVAVADRPPIFNVEPGCRDIAARAAPIGSMEACMRKEQEARDQLVKEWAQFTPADRRYCLDLATMAGEPSYAALLTCLEVMRDARNARQPDEHIATRRKPK